MRSEEYRIDYGVAVLAVEDDGFCWIERHYFFELLRSYVVLYGTVEGDRQDYRCRVESSFSVVLSGVAFLWKRSFRGPEEHQEQLEPIYEALGGRNWFHRPVRPLLPRFCAGRNAV